MIFKICLHFVQLKNIETACGFSWFANKMFKIPPNFMDKVIKIAKLHEYHFPTNFTPLLYALAVQISRMRQKYFKWHIIVKNNKFIETCIRLKYRVQNNVFEVEKQKEVQKLNFLTTVYWKSGGRKKIFVVRRKLKRTAKTNGRLLQKWRKEKNLCCAPEIKTRGKDSLPCVRK
jgi:hypothetical protein